MWTWGFWEGWWPGYPRLGGEQPQLHRALLRDVRQRYGRTVRSQLKDENFVGKPVTDVEWYRPWPPDKKLTWSLRNNTNYMESGCLSTLDYTAKKAKEMLRNFYRKGYNSWQKGVTGSRRVRHCRDQGDPRRVGQMIEPLRNQRIEVVAPDGGRDVRGSTFAKGAFVVRLDQPYRNYAVDLLEPQKFPKTAYEPYDDVSWAFPRTTASRRSASTTRPSSRRPWRRSRSPSRSRAASRAAVPLPPARHGQEACSRPASARSLPDRRSRRSRSLGKPRSTRRARGSFRRRTA